MTYARAIVKIRAFVSPNDAPPTAVAGRPSAGGRLPVLEPSMNHLHAKDRVRLSEDYLDLPRGAVGVVIGFYRNEEPAICVKFELGVRTVPVDLLEPLGEDV